MNKKRISELLTRIGVCPAYKGYPYLVHMLSLAASDNSLSSLVIKELYAATAKYFNVTPACVQHSIRTLLDTYWNQNNLRHFRHITKYPLNEPVPPKEFIAVLADYIQRNQDS